MSRRGIEIFLVVPRIASLRFPQLEMPTGPLAAAGFRLA
jgi:hypothetical protein